MTPESMAKAKSPLHNYEDVPRIVEVVGKASKARRPKNVPGFKPNKKPG